MTRPRAANPPYRLPPPLFHARCKACWFTVGVIALVVASFWSLDLQWAAFFSADAMRSMGRFVCEFVPPDLSAPFVQKVAIGAWETFAMSLLGTLLAAIAGLALALPWSGMLASENFHTRSGEPAVFLAALLVVLLAALAAFAGPLLRALRIDPMQALRQD